MGPKTIPDAELLAQADQVTLWIANAPQPKDMWSLRDAIAWVVSLKAASKVTLHRPAVETSPSAWLLPDQIERLAQLLTADVDNAAA